MNPQFQDFKVKTPRGESRLVTYQIENRRTGKVEDVVWIENGKPTTTIRFGLNRWARRDA